jgi:hypothetical protein
MRTPRSGHVTTLLSVVLALALATPLAAQKSASPGTTKHALHWGAAPAVFPAGAKMAVVSGDPSKAGPFTVELSMPSGYRIAPHFHPTDENVTVKEGTLLVGMGDTLDLKKANAMHRGQGGSIPANHHHFAATRGRTVISITAEGPFAMTYVNPADAPKQH